jgi:hypothetical protein
MLDDLKTKIDNQKLNAEESGLVEKKYSKTFDAEILEPK